MPELVSLVRATIWGGLLHANSEMTGDDQGPVKTTHCTSVISVTTQTTVNFSKQGGGAGSHVGRFQTDVFSRQNKLFVQRLRRGGEAYCLGLSAQHSSEHIFM